MSAKPKHAAKADSFLATVTGKNGLLLRHWRGSWWRCLNGRFEKTTDKAVREKIREQIGRTPRPVYLMIKESCYAPSGVPLSSWL